jgi:hypothetical protein
MIYEIGIHFYSVRLSTRNELSQEFMASLQHLVVNIWSSSNVMAIAIYNPTIWVPERGKIACGSKRKVAKSSTRKSSKCNIYIKNMDIKFLVGTCFQCADNLRGCGLHYEMVIIWVARDCRISELASVCLHVLRCYRLPTFLIMVYYVSSTVYMVRSGHFFLLGFSPSRRRTLSIDDLIFYLVTRSA